MSDDKTRRFGEAGRFLENHILQILMEQGIWTLDDLVTRRLTDEDIDNFFLAPGLLSPKQCQDLKAAVGKHCATGPSPQDTSRREVQARGHHGRYPVDNAELNEQFSSMLSTEAVSQDGLLGWAEDTVRLLLVGKTGAGKSTTGNTILGQERFNTSPSFGSVTSVCERHVGTRGNTRIEIMDSPGLFDTGKNHDKICTTIIQAVAGMHPGPNAILYITKVGRHTEEEHAGYGRLKVIFSDDVTKYFITVFTHGDEVERKGTTLAAILSSPEVPDKLKQVLGECGNRYILFNNESHDKQSQVDELLKMVRKMTAENGNRPYSCPKYSKIGEGLEEEVNKRMAKYEERKLQRNKYVQDLKALTKEAEQKAAETRKEFERKEAQREEEARKVAEKKKMKQDLKNQHAILEADKQREQKELDELRQLIAKQQLEDQERMRKNEKLSNERERFLKQEPEEMKTKERQMQEQVEQQRREDEQRRKADREESKRLEEEKMKLREQHEQQRQKDIEEMEKINRELYERMAKELEAEREQERSRERERQREMEELKSLLAEKEPSVIKRIWNWLW